MKKLLLVLTMLFTLAFSSMAMAADGGDLNKEQKVADQVFNALKLNSTVTYTQVSSGLSSDLTKEFNEQAFTNLQKVVKERFGNFSEGKLFIFLRFDNSDRLIYRTSFSRGKEVIAQLDFDKAGKLLNFAFAPVQKQETKPDASK